MYIDNSIPATYNRIADIDNNYIVLVRESTLESGHNYDAYIQFFSPSTQLIHVEDYQIYGGIPNSNVTYSFNQYYNYIDYIDTSFVVHTMELDESFRTNNLFDRPDISNILIMVGLLLALTIIIVNLATSLIHKGGIFHA